MGPARRIYPVVLAQILACAGYAGLGLVLGWDSDRVQAVGFGLVLAFIFVPGMLGRAVQNAFSEGRYASAAFFARARGLFHWDPEVWREAGILSAWARLKRSPAPTKEDIGALAGRPAALLPLRWVQVSGLTLSGRPAQATDFFERHLGWPQCVETPAAAWLVRAYAEQGRFREALLALAALDRWAGDPELRKKILEQIGTLPALLGRTGAGPAWALTPAEEALLVRWFSDPPPATNEDTGRVRWRHARTASLLAIGLCLIPFALGLWQGDTLLLPRISTMVTFGGDVPALVRLGEWWRLVAAIFLHAGVLHLALNAYALWVLGEFVEGLFGRRGFWLVFLGSGICGTGASAWVARAPVAVGASGGVFGLLGASIGLLIARRNLYAPSSRRALMGQMLFMAVANLALGFSIPQVDNTAHLAGLAGGFLLGLLLHPVAMPDCPAWQKRLQAVLACLGLALVASVGFLAARNASGAGYPSQPGLLKAVHVPDLGYTLSRPAWWDEIHGPPLAWSDRLEMGLALLKPEPEPQGGLDEAELRRDLEGGQSAPGLAWGASRRATLGGHDFLEMPCTFSREGEPVGEVFFLTAHRGRVYAWQMFYAGGWTQAQASALARRILSSLVFEDESQAI